MSDIVQFAILVPLFVIIYQLYAFTISGEGPERQKKCLTLGVVCSTIGITCLVFHSVVAVFGGLILIMFGFRLIAKGLDRIDKKTFIDHYEDDDTPK